MLKELKYFIFFLVISFFIFFSINHYVSDNNKKKTFRQLSLIDSSLKKYENSIPLMINDTEYIVKIMLEDVLEQVSKSKIAEKKFILTADEEAIKIAKKLNIEILKEKNQISESSSVDKASSFLKKEGASGVLRLPGDIPLVTASDIESILEVGIKKKSSLN